MGAVSEKEWVVLDSMDPGWRIHGPFESAEVAEAWATKEEFDENERGFGWDIVELEVPW